MSHLHESNLKVVWSVVELVPLAGTVWVWKYCYLHSWVVYFIRAVCIPLYFFFVYILNLIIIVFFELVDFCLFVSTCRILCYYLDIRCNVQVQWNSSEANSIEGVLIYFKRLGLLNQNFEYLLLLFIIKHRNCWCLQGERKISVLVGISLVFTLHVAGVYWWYHNGDLLYPLIMLPPKAIPPFWHAIFIIMVNGLFFYLINLSFSFHTVYTVVW